MSEPKSIEIFCCAADADQPFLEKLKTRLSVDQKRGTITLWDRSQIEVGKNVNKETRRHLANARIFLLLISPDFLDDDYCYKQVMGTALEKHTRGEARTFPVIVRHTDWKSIPVLKDLQVLPRDGEPLNNQPNEDKALWEVVKEIGKVVRKSDEPESETDPVIESGPSENSPVRLDSASKDKRHTSVSSPLKSSGDSPIPEGGSGVVIKEPVLLHFLKLMVTRRWGWSIIGVLVLLSGILWGMSSSTVAYTKSEDVANSYVYITQGTDLYVYPASGNAVLFIAHCNDLSPRIDCTNIHGNLSVTFLAIPDTISVNTTAPSDTPGRDLHFTQAHAIEQLKLYDQNSNLLGSYTASDYNSNGYYESRWWPIAWELIGAGLVIIAAVVLSTRLRWRKGT